MKSALSASILGAAWALFMACEPFYELTPPTKDYEAAQARGFQCSSGMADLMIFDTHDPAAPKEAGRYAAPAAIRHGASSGDLAYLALADESLEIIDISDKTKPTLLSRLEDARISRIEAAGDLLLCAGNEKALRIIDVADPLYPFVISSLALDDPVCDIAFSSSWTYACTGIGGLAVIDISDPAAPSLAAVLATGGESDSIAI